MKIPKLILILISSSVLLLIAYPLVSIHIRTLAAYRFACEIVSNKVDLSSLEQRLGKAKKTYDGIAQAPDWIQAELAKVTLSENKYAMYLFAYEGLPYFHVVVVCENSTQTPFVSIVRGMNQINVEIKESCKPTH